MPWCIFQKKQALLWHEPSIRDIFDNLHGTGVNLIPLLVLDLHGIEQRRDETEAVRATLEVVHRGVNLHTGRRVDLKHRQGGAHSLDPHRSVRHAREHLLDRRSEPVRTVQLRRRATSGDAGDVALRAPRHHLLDEARHDDEARTGVHRLLGILNAHHGSASNHDSLLLRVLSHAVEASRRRERELADLESCVNRGVHRLGCRSLGGRAQHRGRPPVGDELGNLVHVSLRSHVAISRRAAAEVSACAECAATDAGRHRAAAAEARGGGGGVVLRRVKALGRKKLAERRVLFDLSRHERVVASRRSRVLLQLLLDNFLHRLAAVRDVVHLLRHRGGNDDDAILVSDNRISRANDHASAVDDAVALPRPVRVRSLLWRRAVRVHGEPVVDERVGVAHASVGDESGASLLRESEELDVSTDALPRSAAGHDNRLVRSSHLERLVLRAVLAARLVLLDVRAVHDESARDCASSHLLSRCERPRSLDERVWPSHDPQAVDEALRAERLELGEQVIGDGTCGCCRRSRRECAQGHVAVRCCGCRCGCGRRHDARREHGRDGPEHRR
mmetsp:Transcript_4610/g.11976  ORF Transcript_4610/g.11976 Transcript_4610/m.11976 type:complete len:560 (-) Transcript_4610:380-2059(-)